MKKEIPVSPMKSGEATEIQLLYGVWNILDGDNQQRLEQRLRACGQWANYKDEWRWRGVCEENTKEDKNG